MYKRNHHSIEYNVKLKVPFAICSEVLREDGHVLEKLPLNRI